jgi:hypothetical protein
VLPATGRPSPEGRPVFPFRTDGRSCRTSTDLYCGCRNDRFRTTLRVRRSSLSDPACFRIIPDPTWLELMSASGARNGPLAMSTIRSLTGVDRTWRGQPISVENDPEPTSSKSVVHRNSGPVGMSAPDQGGERCLSRSCIARGPDPSKISLAFMTVAWQRPILDDAKSRKIARRGSARGENEHVDTIV